MSHNPKGSPDSDSPVAVEDGYDSERLRATAGRIIDPFMRVTAQLFKMLEGGKSNTEGR